jgi:uncharacterized protein (TIGR02271 family)
MTEDAAGEAIPLLSEELRVEKRAVATGKVRVRSVVDAVEEVAHATLEEQRIEVTRVPVNQEVSEAPAVRTDGDTVIVPVLEEVLVVEKRLVLKEELHIRRRVTHENVEVPVTLRKQRALIEHVTADGQTRTDEEAIP